MEPDDKGSVVVALQVKKHSFLDDEVQLKKLSRELSKASKDAIDVLVEMLQSEDKRMKMQAAIKLLELDVEVKKTISQDQLQRLIAEVKLSGTGSKTLEIEDGSERKNRPIVDFSNIRSIE
jgi:plasmid stability protein